MKKTILYAAFSISTKEKFEDFLLKQCKVEGFSRIDQKVMWADKDGKIYEEPSHQYVFFALSEENYHRINNWFRRFSIENTLLWEEDGKGRFVDLLGGDGMSRHMMFYNDKEYTKEPAPLFRAWDDTCTGCAFHDDEDLCRNSCNKDDPDTHCCTEGKNYNY